MVNKSVLLLSLCQDKLITSTDITKVEEKVSSQIQSVSYHLVQNHILSAINLYQYCKQKFKFQTYDKSQHQFHKILQHTNLVQRYRIIPFTLDKQLFIGLSDPTDQQALHSAIFELGQKATVILMNENDVESFFNQHFRLSMDEQLKFTLSKLPVTELPTPSEVNYSDEPIIQFVDQLLKDAIDQQVSDIHIEPFSSHTRVRFRRDGYLYEATTLPHHLAMRIITRFKVLASFNIAERRLPQDGRISHSYKEVDIRLNSCPTSHGEKLVLRLLDRKRLNLNLGESGLLPEQQDLLISTLHRPHGLILVTGPTGCGKTMTLYSALTLLNSIDKNVCTIEDPIEMDLPGINQIAINHKIGLDFPQILHGFLRQDPDVLMIGEIRDDEVAKTALQAAQTGHIVISTLHTNSATETFNRLQTLGIPLTYILNATTLIISQRLVRKVCQYCNLKGCEHCRQGYLGRTGIFELLPITEQVQKHLLSSNAHIQTCFNDTKQLTLREVGLLKVKQGITTLKEVNHVIAQAI